MIGQRREEVRNFDEYTVMSLNSASVKTSRTRIVLPLSRVSPISSRTRRRALSRFLSMSTPRIAASFRWLGLLPTLIFLKAVKSYRSPR